MVPPRTRGPHAPPVLDGEDAHELVHPPYSPSLSYASLVNQTHPSRFLDMRDFVDAAGQTIMQYPVALAPSGVTADDERLRCAFCRRVYRGKNAKSMWRRHVRASHDIQLRDQRMTGQNGTYKFGYDAGSVEPDIGENQ
jgi:hypothetical protein